MTKSNKDALMTYLLYQVEVVGGTHFNERFDPSSVELIMDIMYLILNDVDNTLEGVVELNTYNNSNLKK